MAEVCSLKPALAFTQQNLIQVIVIHHSRTCDQPGRSVALLLEVMSGMAAGPVPDHSVRLGRAI